MKEIWKDIEGYEGLYQVSNLGRVKSLKSYKNGKNGIKIPKQEKILKNSLVKRTGYYRVSLSRNGAFISQQVHRLVAKAFIPNPAGYSQINHKDENKSNNVVNNLEWCDSKYNNNYGAHSQHISETRRKNKKGYKKVVQYDLDNNLICEYESTREAARTLNIQNSIISRCCRGLKKTYKNSIWKYKENEYESISKKNNNSFKKKENARGLS